ncbi:MAG: hypothetical protein QW666_02520 [Candidatus Woesearchaeota archaeon]
MSKEKAIITIVGAVLVILGIGGAPIYAVQGDLLRFSVYTCLLVAGIVILGYAAKD